VEEVSKHGMTKQNERKNDSNDDAELEDPFAIRHNFAVLMITSNYFY
jgi:hypothetical protein